MRWLGLYIFSLVFVATALGGYQDLIRSEGASSGGVVQIQALVPPRSRLVLQSGLPGFEMVGQADLGATTYLFLDEDLLLRSRGQSKRSGVVVVDWFGQGREQSLQIELGQTYLRDLKLVKVGWTQLRRITLSPL